VHPLDLPDTTTPDKQSATLSRLCNLPRLHPSAARLLAVSADIDEALKEYEAIFGGDPSLAAELLRTANSVEFGLRARVTNIRFALLLLGAERTRSLAVTIALSKYSRGSVGRAATTPLWRHSVATGVIAEELGRSRTSRESHVYTAGLTHDLGRLGLLLSGAEQYAALLAGHYDTFEAANDAERAAFGMTHGDAGAFLAQSWSFPAVLCDAIRFHHEPPSPDQDDLLCITRSACEVAGLLGYPELQDCGAPEGESGASISSLEQAGLDTERLRELVEQRLSLF
jgi:HD-like signal output (HDOD) protein